MPSLICQARASYKKVSGTLELTNTHLQWTQDNKKTPQVRVPHSEAASLFCSKEGAAQVRMKLGLVADDAGHNFTFTSPQAVANVERETFKKELTTIISNNRASSDAAVKPSPAPSVPQTPSFPAFPTSSAPRGLTRERSVSLMPSNGEHPASPIIPGLEPAKDFRLRKTVLINNPELGALHRDLVAGGQISESDFWAGREHLLLAQAAAEAQRKGKPGQLVDPRPETVDGGEIKIRITPQLVHDIFDEYPVVSRAYSENVPKKLTEEQFWTRYFQSKLFNAHRASIRSSAAQHVVKDDPIFDKYLEKDDDQLEPRRQRTDGFGALVDLGATQEDHNETGNEKDITMQAGRQRGALPLIRKFNEHSERLLNSALGEGPPNKRQRTGDVNHYGEIELEDLRDPESSSGIVLQMESRERYFEGKQSAISEDELALQNLNVRDLIFASNAKLESWDKSLRVMKIDRKPGDEAILSMTQNVASRLDVRSKKNDIPEALLSQMTTCQTAANEFLRQFWTAQYPPQTDTLLGTQTNAQRTAKATRMVEYLSRTQEKVDAIVNSGLFYSVDPARIKTAMKPVVDAVNHALAFYQNKKATSRTK